MAVWHTLLQDPGLLQAILDGLYASEVWRFSQACGVALQSVSSEGRLCCPHVYPSRGTTLSSALRCCQLQQLKSIRPMTELDSDPFLQDLVERLALCSSLEELGPISIDEGGGPYGPEDEVRNRSRPLPAETRCMFSNSSLLVALGNAFEHLRSLERVTLTLRCVHDENEMGHLIAAIGSCKALKQLRLDLDTTMSSGGEMLAAVAQMLHELGPERRLQSLTLGYSWFSEASDETLHELQAAISVLPLHFVGLLAPQDPEMGSLENACSVLGRSVEEVLVMDGWDHDGLVFPVFLEALCQCPRLKRLHLIGEVPDKLDVESFEQTLRARVRNQLPEVCVNSPLGIKIANHTLG